MERKKRQKERENIGGERERDNESTPSLFGPVSLYIFFLKSGVTLVPTLDGNSGIGAHYVE